MSFSFTACQSSIECFQDKWMQINEWGNDCVGHLDNFPPYFIVFSSSFVLKLWNKRSDVLDSTHPLLIFQRPPIEESFKVYLASHSHLSIHLLDKGINILSTHKNVVQVKNASFESLLARLYKQKLCSKMAICSMLCSFIQHNIRLTPHLIFYGSVVWNRTGRL